MSTSYLIINVGCTSIKTRLFDEGLKAIALLNADYGCAAGLDVDGMDKPGQAFRQYHAGVHDAETALGIVLRTWQQWLARDGLKVSAIGHRIVHGGDYFSAITPIDQHVLKQIAQLDSYAPLHNPLNRLGVLMAGQAFPALPQFAVFDTAFHRQIPGYAGRYAIPEHLSEPINFYRYGFHGISCQHSLTTAAQLLACAPTSLNLIILHLGGGASATAVRAGISVDTSMGFSPTEGLIMATRCGDLDPMIAITLQRQGLTVEQVDKLLNQQSGLLGICEDADMRSILQKAEHGDVKAHLAIGMFCYRIKKYIGAYCAVLDNVSALIFTGGIGENAPLIRQKIVQDLGHLGFAIDRNANQLTCQHHLDISAENSRSRILVIHAEEEREIARQMNYFSEVKTHL